MTYTLSPHGLKFIAGWEAFVPYVYDDQAPVHQGQPPEYTGGPHRGVLTIGYGHTDAAAHPLQIAQCIGKRITQQQALEVLDVDLAECVAEVNRLARVALTQGQFDALVSIDFNAGATHLRTLWSRLNAGDYQGARAAFDLYTHSGGEFMRGLQNRRDAEQVLWDGAGESEAAEVTPESYVPTPRAIDAPAPAKTMAQSKTGGAAIGIGGTAIAAGAGEVAKEAVTQARVPDVPHDQLGDIADRLRDIVDSGSSLVDRAPHAPSLWQGLAHTLADPIVLVALCAIAAGLAGFIWFDRRRRLIKDLV